MAELRKVHPEFAGVLKEALLTDLALIPAIRAAVEAGWRPYCNLRDVVRSGVGLLALSEWYEHEWLRLAGKYRRWRARAIILDWE